MSKTPNMIFPSKRVVFSFISLICFSASAQTTLSTNQLDGRVNTINTAVPFLRIGPDARSGAMGDLGIGLSPDANAIYWNTAKIPFAEKDLSVSMTYTPWLKELVPDIYLANLSAFKKIDKLQGITASLRYFSLGNINFTDVNGGSLGSARPHEFALNVGYARKLSDHFSTGINLGYIYSNLAQGQSVNSIKIEAGKAVAGDVSFFYNNKSKLFNTKGDYNIGLTISNIGNKMTYTRSADNANKDYIPTNLGIGAGYTFHFDEYNELSLVGEINKLLVPTPDTTDDNNNKIFDYKEKSVPAGILGSFGDAPGGMKEEFQELMYSVGVEYWYKKQFAIRAGYFNENKLKGNRKYLTAGVGIRYSVFGLNFSYLIPTTIQKSPLDNTLRFSLLFEFDKAKEKKTESK